VLFKTTTPTHKTTHLLLEQPNTSHYLRLQQQQQWEHSRQVPLQNLGHSEMPFFDFSGVNIKLLNMRHNITMKITLSASGTNCDMYISDPTKATLAIDTE
jgi:hypothetical protein